jgi:hypothetical protein
VRTRKSRNCKKHPIRKTIVTLANNKEHKLKGLNARIKLRSDSYSSNPQLRSLMLANADTMPVPGRHIKPGQACTARASRERRGPAPMLSTRGMGV